MFIPCCTGKKRRCRSRYSNSMSERQQRRTSELLGVKPGSLHSLTDCESLCLSDETLKAVGPFYMVSMPGEVKDPTQGVNV